MKLRMVLICGLIGAIACNLGCSKESFSTSLAGSAADSLTNGSVPAGTSVQLCTTGTVSVGIFGAVTDATTRQTLAGVTVTLLDGNGSAAIGATTSDANGNYSFSNVSQGEYQLQFSLANYITFTSGMVQAVSCTGLYQVSASMSPNLAAGQIRIVLTWVGAPANWSLVSNTYQTTVMDMDSYLLVPGYSQPIYWDNCDMNRADGGGVSPCNVTGAYLNVDQINFNGPETMTIDMAVAGTYTYYITNYSDPCNASGLTESNAVVTVYMGSEQIKQYTVNPGAPGVGESGRVFEVFQLTNGQIADVNRYNDSLFANLVQTGVNGGTCNQATNQ